MFYEVKNLFFSYYKSPLIIKNAHFDLNKGENVLLLASNSMGKTTALKVLSGFDETYLGSITIQGAELKKTDDRKKNFSLLLAEPVFFENKSIACNINFALSSAEKESMDDAEISKLLFEINIDKNPKLKVKKLSKFEKRKLAIARSYLKSPTMIFLDDQFEGLSDEESREMEKIYGELLTRHQVILAASDESFLKHKAFFESQKFAKVCYLCLSELFCYNSFSEFVKSKVKLNAMNFIEGYNSLEGVIFRSNDCYLFAISDVREIQLEKRFSGALDKLQLSVGESEKITLFFKGELDMGSIEEKSFNAKLASGEIIAFSNLDGSRVLNCCTK